MLFQQLPRVIAGHYDIIDQWQNRLRFDIFWKTVHGILRMY